MGFVSRRSLRTAYAGAVEDVLGWMSGAPIRVLNGPGGELVRLSALTPRKVDARTSSSVGVGTRCFHWQIRGRRWRRSSVRYGSTYRRARCSIYLADVRGTTSGTPP